MNNSDQIQTDKKERGDSMDLNRNREQSFPGPGHYNPKRIESRSSIAGMKENNTSQTDLARKDRSPPLPTRRTQEW